MFKRFYPYEYAENVFCIDYGKLYKKGYKGIIFDIDNTLVHHGDDSTPEIDSLFNEIHNIGLKTLLLTDNNQKRVERFMKNIDSLYICEAQKPCVDAYNKAVKMLGAEKKEIICIGDQIFKDILGANKSGIASILVQFIRLEGEVKIGKRRQAEKVILWFYKKNKRFRHRLGDIWKREG